MVGVGGAEVEGTNDRGLGKRAVTFQSDLWSVRAQVTVHIGGIAARALLMVVCRDAEP